MGALKMEFTNGSIKAQLKDMSEEQYRQFSAKLLPGVQNILGVRIPSLRKLAREIAKGDYGGYLENACGDTFEEILLQGMVIGVCKADAQTKFGYIEKFVPKIDNWSVCDSFCTGLKFIEKNKQQAWEFIMPYLKSDKEFEIRFAVVVMLNYFVDGEHIDEILEICSKIHHDGYYVKMAVAWLLSVCVAKQKEKTVEFLSGENGLDDFTQNKSVQKCVESYRIDNETKKLLKQLKR